MGLLKALHFLTFRFLSWENQPVPDLEVRYSGSLDIYLEKWCSDLFYSTRLLNFEVSHFHECEFLQLFEMVNLIIQELSQIKLIAIPLFKIIVQATTLPNLKIREWLPDGFCQLRKKLELSRVPVLEVIKV